MFLKCLIVAVLTTVNVYAEWSYTSIFEKISSTDCAGNDTIFKTVKNVTLISCSTAVKAVQKSTFNFLKDNKNGYSALGECQIVNALNKKVNLVPTPLCNHYQVVNKLRQPNQCHNGGTLIDNFKNASCSCLNLFGGKTCQDLVCSSCTRHNGLVIHLPIKASVDYDTALTICLKKNMTLHMPKTEDIFNFTRDYLFEENNNSYNGYWIGLNRTSSNDTFTWVDGTKLGSFQPWRPGRPTIGLCVDMSNDKNSSYAFYDRNCDIVSIDVWKFMPICEKRF